VSARFVLGKVAGAIGTLAFVLAFNFFLFRSFVFAYCIFAFFTACVFFIHFIALLRFL